MSSREMKANSCSFRLIVDRPATSKSSADFDAKSDKALGLDRSLVCQRIEATLLISLDSDIGVHE